MKQLVFHPEWMPLLFDDAGEAAALGWAHALVGVGFWVLGV